MVRCQEIVENVFALDAKLLLLTLLWLSSSFSVQVRLKVRRELEITEAMANMTAVD